MTTTRRRICTKSGAVYMLTTQADPATGLSHSITRFAEWEIIGLPDVHLIAEPVRQFESPVVGEQFRYRTDHGWLLTSRVVSVEQDYGFAQIVLDNLDITVEAPS